MIKLRDATRTAPPRRPGALELLVFAATVAAAPVVYYLLKRGDGPKLIALAVVVSVGAAIATYAPLVGLVGMVALTVGNVSENLINSFGAPSVAKLAGPGLAFILGARWALFRERPFFDIPALSLFLAFAAVMALSMVHAQYWDEAREATIDYLKDIILVFLTLAFFHKPGALRLYVTSAIAILAVICVLSLWQVATGDYSNDFGGFARFRYASNRLSGPIDDPNFFAATLVFFIPIVARFIVFGESRRTQIAGALLCGLFMACIIFSTSRGALIALFGCFCLFCLLLDRRSLGLTLAITIPAGVVVAAFLSDTLIRRFAAIFAPLETVQTDAAIEGRLASWRVAAELFFQNPLLGVGAGNYNGHFQDTALQLGLIFRGEGRSAHSLYLEILAELGIVGLITFLVVIMAAGLGCLRGLRRLKAAGLERHYTLYATFGIGLFGYLIAMIFLHDSYPRHLFTTIAVAIAMPRIAALEVERAARQRIEQGGPAG